MIALPHPLSMLAPRATAALDAWSVRGKDHCGEWIKRTGI
ncbi:hypothetical protein J2851_002124 [Azospirillum rugosum]|uniref:Uncharacterized protein n=1 Tax=Azospirillum rugosum TaxID=416170 RepID=A0ABS4SJE8_9PROT|nr:hypothetical protein [Azospirillum rugosum]MDQ0526113.1 hypothetical protein [Azospirillum rugosum]